MVPVKKKILIIEMSGLTIYRHILSSFVYCSIKKLEYRVLLLYKYKITTHYAAVLI